MEDKLPSIHTLLSKARGWTGTLHRNVSFSYSPGRAETPAAACRALAQAQAMGHRDSSGVDHSKHLHPGAPALLLTLGPPSGLTVCVCFRVLLPGESLQQQLPVLTACRSSSSCQGLLSPSSLAQWSDPYSELPGPWLLPGPASRTCCRNVCATPSCLGLGRPLCCTSPRGVTLCSLRHSRPGVSLHSFAEHKLLQSRSL